MPHYTCIHAQAEFIGTFMQAFISLAVAEQGLLLPTPADAKAYNVNTVPFVVALLKTALLLSFSGPTGYASNPARDMSPRIVHALVPFPNKGSSEFG